MKPDKLDQILNKTNKDFDIYSPPAGHEDRFKAKLMKTESNVRKFFFLKAASVIFLAFLSGALCYHYFVTPGNEEAYLLNEPEEYRNMEKYYSGQVDARLTEIKTSSLVSGEQKDRIEDEMQELKNMYSQLQEELKTHPKDERIINAMIRNYQSRVDLLNLILAQLNEIKKRNNYEIRKEADI